MIVNTGSFFGVTKGIGVSIANSSPRTFSGDVLVEALPGWEIVNAYRNNHIDKAEYEVQYLSRLDVNNLLTALSSLGYEEVTLCCWEKNGDFCHRHLVADVIKKHGHEYGIELGEEK